MSPIHFKILEKAFGACGYNFVVLDAVDPKAVEAGLKYVNNDACYPSLLVAGQMIAALESGKYDLDRVALIITQTGGGCRATNYIGFIRRALNDAGWGHIPVLSLSAQGFEYNDPQFLEGRQPQLFSFFSASAAWAQKLMQFHLQMQLQPLETFFLLLLILTKELPPSALYFYPLAAVQKVLVTLIQDFVTI